MTAAQSPEGLLNLRIEEIVARPTSQQLRDQENRAKIEALQEAAEQARKLARPRLDPKILTGTN